MLKPVLTNPWVQAAALLAALVLFFALVYVLSPILIPLSIAFIVAYVLHPVVNFMERRKISRGLAVSSLAVLAVVLLLSLPLFVVPRIVEQGRMLADQDRTAEADVQPLTAIDRWTDHLLERLPLKELVEVTGWGQPANNDEAIALVRERLGQYIADQVTNLARQLAPAGMDAGASLWSIAASLGGMVVQSVLFIANFALFSFVAGYLLKDYDTIVENSRALIPPRARDKTIDIVGRIDDQMRAFLRGQLTVALCLGAMYATGLLICGVPFALLIGLMGIVASFIPYLGIVITLIPALLLTLVQYGIGWQLLGVLITFAVAQFLEGNVLTPKIVGEQVGLNPVWVILAILVFGTFLGFLGLLIAVPLAAALKVLVLEGVEYYKHSQVFKGSSSDGSNGSGSET